MMYTTLTEKEELLGKEIVNAAYKVHRELGRDYWKKFMKFVFVMNCKREGYRVKDKLN